VYAFHSFYQPYAVQLMNINESIIIAVHIGIAAFLSTYPDTNNPVSQTGVATVVCITAATMVTLAILQHSGTLFISNVRPHSLYALHLSRKDSRVEPMVRSRDGGGIQPYNPLRQRYPVSGQSQNDLRESLLTGTNDHINQDINTVSSTFDDQTDVKLQRIDPYCDRIQTNVTTTLSTNQIELSSLSGNEFQR